MFILIFCSKTGRDLKKFLYEKEFTYAFALIDSREIDTVIDDSTGLVIHLRKILSSILNKPTNVIYMCDLLC